MENMEKAAAFAWDDEYLLGYPPMDSTHEEFVELVDALLSCSDDCFATVLEAFERHAEVHFAQEYAWMKSNDFPASACHVEEHEEVLESVRKVRVLVAEGDMEIGREFARALVDWFPAHAAYMDSALARWMVWRTHRAAPLVLRRTRGCTSSA